MNWLLRQLYRQYRIVWWIRQAAVRRLTAAGWVTLVCLVLTMVMGVNRENMLAYQAIALLFVLSLTSGISSFFNRSKISVIRHLPRFGTVGQPVTYAVTAKNLNRKTKQGIILLEDLADPNPSFQEWKAARLAEQRYLRPFSLSRGPATVPHAGAIVSATPLPALPPGREVEATASLTPVRRGLLRLAGVSAGRTDPFGLFRGFRKIEQSGKILILPKRYPLPPLALPGSLKYQEGGVALAANVGQSEEFVALRDYRRGDPIRHIHWRSWARTGKPIVKEFEDEFFVRHALVLDTFCDLPNSELFEEAVSVAASFAYTVQTQESLLDLLFVGADAYCFTAGRGLAHGDQMLEILASVQPARGKKFADLENLVVNHSGLVSNCICVFLDWDEPRHRFVRELRAAGVPVLAVVLVDKPPRQPLDPGPLRDEPGSFHTLVAGNIEAGLQKL